MATIRVIVGTVMGTSEALAIAASEYLETKGHACSIHKAFEASILGDISDILLICTSNTGMGDLPANIAPLYVHLTTQYPRIAGQKYGLINLGDSSYPNFGQAGRTLDDALTDLGAVRVGELYTMDACEIEDHINVGLKWVAKWEAAL